MGVLDIIWFLLIGIAILSCITCRINKFIYDREAIKDLEKKIAELEKKD